jgi:hypothetical protein
MPLVCSDPTYKDFFKIPAVLMDTCGLTWFTRRPNGIHEFARICGSYVVLIPTPVIYELAFGLPGKPDVAESDLQAMLNQSAEIDLYKYGNAVQGNVVVAPGGYLVNPGHLEWWSARERLLKYLSNAGPSVKISKQKDRLSLDALIHSCARNTFAPICTNNADDFRKLNQGGKQQSTNGAVPFFTPEKVLLALTEQVEFEV